MAQRALIVLMLGVVAVAALPASAEPPDATPLLPADPWEVASFHAPDGAAESEMAAPGADETTIARVTVSEVPANRWEIGFAWDTVAPVEADETLVLNFEARAEGDGEPPGSVNLAFRRAEKPYHHALSETVTFGEDWREFRIAFPAPVEVPAGEGTLRVNLGTQRQTVEMRNLSLANYGGEVSFLALCRMLGIDPGAAGNRPVGRHLTPDLLWEMGVFGDFPPADPGFDPAGAWEQTWRIWTCYGYAGRANQNLGVLRIARTAGDPVSLEVEQQQLNTEGQQHVQTAKIICALDAIATPLSWEHTSSFIGPEGEEQANLRLEHAVETPPEGPVATHWGLFEAVQRLPFEEGVEHRFDVLDNLTARKADHTLRYDGAHEVRFGPDTRRLHRFVQTGHGALPFEYWLDADHRLVLVISEYRVYVLDPGAAETFAGAQESQGARYERIRQRYAPDTEDDGDE